MKIALSQIHPSPNPIRKTWDEEKMNELVQSIKEQGLIVPIKVRPDNGKYEIVYGHRRMEAARRAGLSEIEAIVEGVDDGDTLIQSLIENVVREDMGEVDKAIAVERLMNTTGWTAQDISRKGLMSDMEVYRLKSLIPLPDDLKKEIGKSISKRHVYEVNKILDKNHHGGLAEKVLRKSVKENLSLPQAEKVAESIAATKDPRRREALLQTPYSSFIHDPEINRERAEKYGEYDPLSVSKNASKSDEWALTTEVKIVLDYLQSSNNMTEEIIKMDELGKFAPEARSFVARKIALMIKEWQKVIEKLGK